MGLRDIEATLPPGFRFCPSDEELVCHYLYKKVSGEKLSKGILMVEVNLHLCEPWQLPDAAKVGANEWYFFSFRDRKYATGFRSNRATTNGFWKATGKDKQVFDPTTNVIVGMRKTLVFYMGRAPNGMKTGWVMHEFRLENQHAPPKEDWVLCRVIHKAKEQLNNTNHGLIDQDDSYRPLCTSSPTNLSSSPPVGQTIPTEYQQLTLTSQFPNHHDNDNPNIWSTSCITTTFLDQQLQKEEVLNGGVPINEISSRSGDEFLFDMCLDNIALGDEDMPCLEDENSMVLF